MTGNYLDTFKINYQCNVHFYTTEFTCCFPRKNNNVFLIGGRVNVKHVTREGNAVDVLHIDLKTMFEIRSADDMMNAFKTITDHLLPLCEHINVSKYEPKKIEFCKDNECHSN